MPLRYEIAALKQDVRANLLEAEALIAGLSRRQFNWRNEPGRWSIGQCIGHLNLINSAEIARLESAIDAGRAKGLRGSGPYRYGWFSRKFVSKMEVPATSKFKAPKHYVPPAETEVVATFTEYRRISNEIIQLMEKADGLDLGKVKTALSGIPLIKMPLGARLSLLTTHDRRHLWQGDQVRKASGFPK